MSYCRFSSAGHQCDLYIYQATDGYVTHVASHRRDQPIPELDLTDEKTISASLAARNDAISRSALIPIGGIYDGATFVDETAHGLRERLADLARAGYRYPATLLDTID